MAQASACAPFQSAPRSYFKRGAFLFHHGLRRRLIRSADLAASAKLCGFFLWLLRDANSVFSFCNATSYHDCV